MYAAELVFSNTHYHCSQLLVRTQHEWLLRLVRDSRLRPLLEGANTVYKMLDLSEDVRGLGDIHINSLDDLLTHMHVRDSTVMHLVSSAALAVGYPNIVQFLANRHAILILYGAAMGCHEPNVYCILEPRFEVRDHERNRELEKERLLPYRLFDLLVVEDDKIHLIEVKYLLSYEKNPRRRIPGGTMLAHLASFIEKLVSTAQLLHEPLSQASYTVKYHFAVIPGPGREIEERIWRHIERIVNALESLIGAPVEPRNAPYHDVAERTRNTNPTPPYSHKVEV